jgi:hypothetical protein
MACNLTLSGLLGTLKSTFRIDKLTVDASALTVARTVNVPDKAGTLAMTSDITALLPTGTRLVFAQAAAPTGWTQIVDDGATNRMLRVVNTAGAGVAGSDSPISCSVVASHTHGFTSGNASATHTHTTTTGNASATHTHSGTSGGASANHTHTGTSGGISANHYHAGTTSGHNVDHAHYITTGTVSSDHTHTFSSTLGTHNHTQDAHGHALNMKSAAGFAGGAYTLYIPGTPSAGNTANATPTNNAASAGTASGTTSGISANHTHAGWTGGVNTDHSHTYSTGWVSSDHTHTTTTGGHSVDHTHTTTTGTESVTHTHTGTSGTESAVHTHSGITNANGSAANWTPRYIDTIICSKN